MRIAVVFVLLGAFGAEGHPPKQTPTPLISVLVFDYAGVSGEVLNAGLGNATRILKSGGVEVVWVHCPVAPELLALVRPCRDAPGPLALVLHILPRGVTTRQTDPGSAGFAVPPEDGGFGAFAGVFPIGSGNLLPPSTRLRCSDPSSRTNLAICCWGLASIQPAES